MASTDHPSSGSSPTEPSKLDSTGLLELIADAKIGSDGARNELIRSLYGYLLTVANQELDSGVRPKVGASDLVQSALVLAEQNLDQFRGDSSKTLLAWLRQILRNEIKTARREYFQTEKRNVNREIPQDGHSAWPIADDHPSPRAEAIMHEEATSLREALLKLSHDHRTVIVLRNWEKLTFDEIGSRMNRSADAVKKLWTRAIRQLQRELTE